MNRPVVEFPLFYGDEREDVREFLGNYRRAGLLNGWDEEKLALGLPLFLKKHASVWFKTLTEADENESFQVLSQKLISHFESKVTLWQLRQKLEEIYIKSTILSKDSTEKLKLRLSALGQTHNVWVSETLHMRFPVYGS